MPPLRGLDRRRRRHRASAPVVDPDVLADISMTSVPPDVIVPTNDSFVGRGDQPDQRSPRRPPPAARGARLRDRERPGSCLPGMLDMLGFDVTSGSSDDRQRRVQRATAVVQLDAGLAVTGQPDDALLRYLGMATDGASRRRATRRARSARRRRGGRSWPMRYRRRAQDGARRRSDPRRRGGRPAGPAACAVAAAARRDHAVGRPHHEPRRPRRSTPASWPMAPTRTGGRRASPSSRPCTTSRSPPGRR